MDEEGEMYNKYGEIHWTQCIFNKYDENTFFKRIMTTNKPVIPK